MIEIKDVSFTYESGESENSLRNINLKIEDGETVLLCGSVRRRIYEELVLVE